jgi:hypothetical protein
MHCQADRVGGRRIEVAPFRKLPVDLDDLCIALETAAGEMSWYLDGHTGNTILVTAEYDPVEQEGPSLDEIEADPSRYLPIPAADNREALRDMESFIQGLADARLKESLELALAAPKPFRRFKSVLAYVPEQRRQWLEFKSERTELRALEWLKLQAIEPVPRSRR